MKSLDKPNNQNFMVSQETSLFNKASLGSALAWLIWIIGAVFVLFQFLLQLSSGVIIEGLMKSFSLSAFGGGLLASAYYYTYVLLQAPAGLLMDRFGTRCLLSIGAAVCSFGCILFGTAHHVSLALLGRILMGAGTSFAFVGSMNLAYQWFPLNRFGFMTAIAEVIGMIGSLLGGYYLAHLVQVYGWRLTIDAAAFIALAIAILLGTFVRNAPQNKPVTTSNNKIKLWSEMKLLFKNPILWLNGIYSAALFSVVTVFVALWAIPFMQKAHHLTLSKATLLCNLVFIGVALGAPILGWLDTRIRLRSILMMVCAFITAALLSILIFDLRLSLSTVEILMLLLGASSSSYILNFIIANQVSNSHTRSTCVGLTNMLSVASAPILQPLIGLILYLVSHNAHQTNFTAYTVTHFQIALCIVPLFVIIAGIISLWLPNQSPKS